MHTNLERAEFQYEMNRHTDVFNKIFEQCNNSFWNGCGSYLFDGHQYKYDDRMLDKQIALFNLAKNATNALELGVYMGHSLLIMLMANPSIKLTAIDISDRFTRPAITVLEEHFKTNISFIHAANLDALRSLNGTFDLIHIDGDHRPDIVEQEFVASKRLAIPGKTVFVFDDFDAVKASVDKNAALYGTDYTVTNCMYRNAWFRHS